MKPRHLWTVENPCTQEIKLLTPLLINNHGKNKIRNKINDHLIEKLTKQPFNLHIPSCCSFHISFCSVSSASTARHERGQRKRNELHFPGHKTHPFVHLSYFQSNKSICFHTVQFRPNSTKLLPAALTLWYNLLFSHSNNFSIDLRVWKTNEGKVYSWLVLEKLFCSCFLCERGRSIKRWQGRSGLHSPWSSTKAQPHMNFPLNIYAYILKYFEFTSLWFKTISLHSKCRFIYLFNLNLHFFRKYFAVLKK